MNICICICIHANMIRHTHSANWKLSTYCLFRSPRSIPQRRPSSKNSLTTLSSQSQAARFFEATGGIKGVLAIHWSCQLNGLVWTLTTVQIWSNRTVSGIRRVWMCLVYFGVGSWSSHNQNCSSEGNIMQHTSTIPRCSCPGTRWKQPFSTSLAPFRHLSGFSHFTSSRSNLRSRRLQTWDTSWTCDKKLIQNIQKLRTYYK